MDQFPSVYIVLVNWNGLRDTSVCLASLKEVDYPRVKVVVVDNNSSDDSVKSIRKKFPDITVLESDRNRGFAGGNNIGIRHALENGADYVWLLNNDTLIEENALKTLVSRMQEDPGIGICGSTLIYYPQRDMLQALGGGTYNKWLGITHEVGKGTSAEQTAGREEVEERLDYIAGASMLVSRPFLEEVGLMEEEYFLYFEEIDWAYRARGKFRLGYAPDSRVYHKEGATIQGNNMKPESRSYISDYYQVRNRLRFTWKYHPLLLPLTYLTLAGSMVNRVLRKQWGRVPMILKLMLTFNLNVRNPKPSYDRTDDEPGFPDMPRQTSGGFF